MLPCCDGGYAVAPLGWQGPRAGRLDELERLL